MGRICDKCIYQEQRYDGVPICQHIQSMRGMEAAEEYALCEDIKECEYCNPKTEVDT